MSIRFETEKDLNRENKAADFLCNMLKHLLFFYNFLRN